MVITISLAHREEQRQRTDVRNEVLQRSRTTKSTPCPTVELSSGRLLGTSDQKLGSTNNGNTPKPSLGMLSIRRVSLPWTWGRLRSHWMGNPASQPRNSAILHPRNPVRRQRWIYGLRRAPRNSRRPHRSTYVKWFEGIRNRELSNNSGRFAMDLLIVSVS